MATRHWLIAQTGPQCLVAGWQFCRSRPSAIRAAHYVGTIPQEGAGIPQEGAVTPLPHPAGGCLEGKERKKGTEPCAGDSELPLFPTAEDIYQAYPKHVAKADALKAIEKAMKKVEPQRLRDAVTAYAKAVAGSDAQFIPYPASWFNSERYSDDPKTWGRSEPKQPEAKQPYNPIL